jgi:hypothetical protein
VLTNVSSAHQRCEVLRQIPEGSFPVGKDGKRGLSTKTDFVDIPAYKTKVLEYLFYFPGPGRYPHFPVHLSKNEEVTHHILAYPYWNVSLRDMVVLS